MVAIVQVGLGGLFAWHLYVKPASELLREEQMYSEHLGHTVRGYRLMQERGM